MKPTAGFFSRLGLRFRAVEADTGPIGGNFSHEFMVLADTGEDVIVTCTGCDYAANTEKAEIAKPAVRDVDPADFQELKRIETPNMRTIEEVAGFLKVEPKDLIKTLVFTSSHGPVVALVRGNHDINEVKLRNYLKCDTLELAGEDVVEKITGAPLGFAGPMGMKNVRIVADFGLQGCCNMATGGNERDVHVVNVNFERDFSVSGFADIRSAQAGDRCPRCGKTLATTRGIEVGHIFKLGTKYSKAMNCSYLDRQGRAQPMIMGCYGIGVGRTVAAAIEQSHDENGIIFPAPIAPFSVIVVPVNTNDAVQMDIAVNLYNGLVARGLDVLLDDRDERPGIKFKDADLIGIPLRVTVGKNAAEKKQVDIKERKGGDAQQVAIDEAVAVIERRLKQPEV